MTWLVLPDLLLLVVVSVMVLVVIVVAWGFGDKDDGEVDEARHTPTTRWYENLMTLPRYVGGRLGGSGNVYVSIYIIDQSTSS